MEHSDLDSYVHEFPNVRSFYQFSMAFAFAEIFPWISHLKSNTFQRGCSGIQAGQPRLIWWHRPNKLRSCRNMWIIQKKYHTIWLFNIAMENPPILKFGKPSISMGHGFHGYVSHNQRVLESQQPGMIEWSKSGHLRIRPSEKRYRFLLYLSAIPYGWLVELGWTLSHGYESN